MKGGIETRIVLRPLASPLALGFLGLAGASFVLAGLNLGWVEAAEGESVALIVIAFTAPLQLLASILAFLARDCAVATAMGLLSGIWLAQALVLLSSPPGSTSDALGLFLLVGAVAMLVPASAAARSKLVPALVLSVAALRFVLTGVAHLTSSDAWMDAAGAVGIALAVVAVYAASAAELEDAEGTAVLPLGRRGGSTDDPAPDARRLAREPGVRGEL